MKNNLFDIRETLKSAKENLTTIAIEQNWFVKETVKNSPLEIIIKPELLDLSNIKTGEGIKGLYRPNSFNEYIGQQKAKNRIDFYIKGSKEFGKKFPHTFLSAPSGCGKTTLALILANILNEKLITCQAGELKSEQQFVDKIVECDGGILFIDEAHRISVKVGTFMLTVMEEFKIQGKQLQKPFTIIFATTHKGNIAKNLEALIQRFPLQIQLTNYSELELTTILKQYHSKNYSNVQVSDEVFLQIAKNARLTPRIAQSLLTEYIYIKDLENVLLNNGIVKDGITENDIKVLKYLLQMGGAGQASLAKYLRVEPNTYAFEIEPYLIYKEYITVENKRKITEVGETFLKGI